MSARGSCRALIRAALVGDGGARHRGVEHVRTAQHRERSHEPTERPAPNGHPPQVQIGVGGCGMVQGVDLIVEHGGGEVAPYAALPGRAPPRRAPAIDHQHGEALVGEPLGDQEVGAPT